MRRRRDKSLACATPHRRARSFDLARSGLVYGIMMLFIGIAAVNSQANLLFGVFGLMVGVLIVSVSMGRIVLRKLSIRRVIPEHLIVGQRVILTYEFQNRKRFWPSVSVTLTELSGLDVFSRPPMAYMLHAAAGTTAVVPSEAVPIRRGVYTLDQFQIGTSFPFGFVRRVVQQQQMDRIVVYPALGEVDAQVLEHCRSAELVGTTLRPHRGGTDEFYGLKEYRNGENPRWIYWRRSARTGTLVAKDMTQVAPPRVLLVVDTMLVDRLPSTCVEVERAIAMAASLARCALDAGFSVGLHAWSNGYITIAPQRGKRQSRDILTALARLGPNFTHGPQNLLDQSHPFLDAGTTPVLLTAQDIQIGTHDRSRVGMLVFSTKSSQTHHWFHFDPTIDFSKCAPLSFTLNTEPSSHV